MERTSQSGESGELTNLSSSWINTKSNGPIPFSWTPLPGCAQAAEHLGEKWTRQTPG